MSSDKTYKMARLKSEAPNLSRANKIALLKVVVRHDSKKIKEVVGDGTLIFLDGLSEEAIKEMFDLVVNKISSKK